MNKILPKIILWLTFLLVIQGCGHHKHNENISGNESSNTAVMKEKWGTVDGTDVYLYTLKNKNGILVRISTYGAIITSIITPDSKGNFGDIVLGYDSLKDYIAGSPYFGAIVGRYANRIAKGMFKLSGKVYRLAKNNGNNCLHGGIKGFDKVVWKAHEITSSDGTGLVLTYQSRDGEEGFPGNLTVTVNYFLNNKDELKTEIQAFTDKSTPVNLCNHSYFNLTGCQTNILDHLLKINADRYTVVNPELIPTGELRPVAGTPMDFSEFRVIGTRIDWVKGGYDHNYVLVRKDGELSLGAVVKEPVSGRILEVYTTQPGIQFYSGNFLDGTLKGKDGKIYKQHWGLCLETQHFPDSPNQPSFPNTILRPGEKYHEVTVYRFGIVK